MTLYQGNPYPFPSTCLESLLGRKKGQGEGGEREFLQFQSIQINALHQVDFIPNKLGLSVAVKTYLKGLSALLLAIQPWHLLTCPHIFDLLNRSVPLGADIFLGCSAEQDVDRFFKKWLTNLKGISPVAFLRLCYISVRCEFPLGRHCNLQCSVKQMSWPQNPWGKGTALQDSCFRGKTVLEFCGPDFDTMISDVQYQNI